MDENFPWEAVFLAVFFSLLVLGIAYFFISPKESTYFSTEKTEKAAEFKRTRIEGRKEGKKAWEFSCRSGWTTKDQNVTYLQNVYNGKIYKDDELSVSSLKAQLVKISKPGDIIEASGSGQGRPITANLDLKKFSPIAKQQSEWTKLIADQVKYYPEGKRSEVFGNISLIKSRAVIKADKIEIDHENKTADFSGNISIKRQNGRITAQKLKYFGDDEQCLANDQVVMKLKEGRVNTRIKCDQASFNNDIEKDIALSGSLEVVQGKKLAVAKEGIYSNKAHGLTLKNNVKAVMEKARVIIGDKELTSLDNPNAGKILKNKTYITANEMFFSTKNSDARATGNVVVTQKDHEARSETAYFNNRENIIILTGNVQLKEENDWIKCKKVIISINQETFEAIGSVEASFGL